MDVRGDPRPALREISNVFIEHLNDTPLEYRNPRGARILACVHTGFQAQFDAYPGHLTWEQLNAIVKAWEMSAPNLHCKVDNISVDVNDRAGTATVFMELEFTGVEDTLTMRAFAEMKWAKDEADKWWFHRFHGLRADMTKGLVSEAVD
ncbi:hypothetical protein Slin15195_G031750 [Septoria linicola]|uniref:SnoaL-like domain-containing protein n=1 Tax=Septoria linicola TaxID=215465 RepID=A0A9Q9ASC4_9PEZI|nr:hypothetical protein Slin14017_G030770 [Septoria linicola]USW49856.1 hypothetical protein Slin15195_G031750 [Septoria linicola]